MPDTLADLVADFAPYAAPFRPGEISDPRPLTLALYPAPVSSAVGDVENREERIAVIQA